MIPPAAMIDRFPLPVCQFARASLASRCRRFRGEAAFGKETLVRQTFYGVRVHIACPAGMARRHHPLLGGHRQGP
jgi:hypothetical protein